MRHKVAKTVVSAVAAHRGDFGERAQMLAQV
jgi:hypothetical protein